MEAGADGKFSRVQFESDQAMFNRITVPSAVGEQGMPSDWGVSVIRYQSKTVH